MSERDPFAVWRRTVEPVLEPLTLTEAKLHARIVQDAGNRTLESYLRASRDAAETHLGRGLLTQTWELRLAQFADEMPLPMAAPLQSVTSVQYYDSTGTLQTLASTYYDVDSVSRPARLRRAANQVFPTLHADRSGGRVIVTYIVGWTTQALVPERIKQGIRIYLYALESNRDGMNPGWAPAVASAEACWDDRITVPDPRAWCAA